MEKKVPDNEFENDFPFPVDLNIDQIIGDENIDDSSYHEDILLLRQAWINESMAPEILMYESEVITKVMEMIQQQIQHITSLEETGDSHDYFMTMLYQMEIDRINYMLKSYLRIRLKKIREFIFYINLEQNMLYRLSESEIDFAQKYHNLLVDTLNSSFLQYIPEKFNGLTDKNEDVNMIDNPNLLNFVFVRIMENLGSTQLAEDLRVDLQANDIVMVKYIALRAFIFQDKVRLI